MPKKKLYTETRYRSVGNTVFAEHENTFNRTTFASGISSSPTIPFEGLLSKNIEEGTNDTHKKKLFSTGKSMIDKAAFAMEFVHGHDDREEIVKTNYPYNIICLLSIQSKYYRDALQGTGFFISKRCVLTAGHCVFDKDTQTWMDSITVIPGANSSIYPFGQSVSQKYRSVEGWVNDLNSNFDYGAIILNDDSLYNQIKAHMGFQVSDRMTSLEIAGYPRDKGKVPHMARGKINDKSPYRFFYNIDTESGNSGSPIFHYDENDIRAIGIHTTGEYPENYGIRFRPELLDRLNEWILL